ncbi:23S rRNA (adenine(2030)-N(6))-methyltransferase RlmJ [Alkalimarinus coralli]|uniref:23S rRNA (adenine(2030)-N(6))-methyltransferase RlmJ n=1 Tax=Alkalimarinus coralli TaxID=2935863 RepID=UPI00202B1591|nr:23S rRNA (adenine(2030)-N(6))-methyltransferase RlmJ [Alkalimarinus coralli]
MIEQKGSGLSDSGNLFDVHKHLVVICILGILKKKTNGFYYIDGHAGAGIHELSEEPLEGRVSVGVQSVMKTHSHKLIEKYVDIARGYSKELPLSKYPGVPMIVRKLMRSGDRMCLIELDTEKYSGLCSAFQSDPQVQVEHGAADRMLKRLPDADSEGLILIDPDYVIDEDHADTANLIIQCCARWSNATMVVSLPVTGCKTRDRYIISILKDAGMKDLIVSEIAFCDSASEPSNTNQHISRILLVNPSSDIQNEIESVLSDMVGALPPSSRAKSVIETA